MNATITTPAGNKVRTQSRRRYVVVMDYTKADGTVVSGVAKRSDNPAVADQYRQTHGPVTNFVDGTRRAFYIYDTITGQQIA